MELKSQNITINICVIFIYVIFILKIKTLIVSQDS
jgi:hypothetical protein